MDLLYIDATSGGLLLQLLLGGVGGAAAVLKIVFGRSRGDSDEGSDEAIPDTDASTAAEPGDRASDAA